MKATYDIMALISSFGIAYRLAEKYRTLDPLSAGAMSLVAFMMTIPQNTLFTPVHAAGAETATTPKAIAEQCEVIITMLPNSPHVK
ncbi:hypothetical protein O5477_26740, partial [Escherichia coli]|nr:hypothetical protein [Escherichia coli]